jgi:hypothetical protein
LTLNLFLGADPRAQTVDGRVRHVGEGRSGSMAQRLFLIACPFGKGHAAASVSRRNRWKVAMAHTTASGMRRGRMPSLVSRRIVLRHQRFHLSVKMRDGKPYRGWGPGTRGVRGSLISKLHEPARRTPFLVGRATASIRNLLS